MKFFVSLTVIAFVSAVVYYLYQNNKKRAIVLTGTVAFILLSFLTIIMYKDATAPDIQCSKTHTTTSTPPVNLKTATDYFLQGNYDYDTGNCAKAIVDYTASIKLDPGSEQTYNNRAYTYMRMRSYKDALPDLNQAISINPNYINALMNRGDIFNYYLVDRKSAIADYQKVIVLGGTKGTSVCGHLFLAEHNGWNLGTILALPSAYIKCR